MIKDAINQGILRESSEQAHLVITSLLKEMGFEKIQIIDVGTVLLPVKK